MSRYLARYRPVQCPCGECASVGAESPPGWAAVAVPPPDRPAAVRAQAAEVYRRAVEEAGGPWDSEAQAAYQKILNIPAMASLSDSPASASGPIRTWIARAIAAVPRSWSDAGDRRASSVGALASYGAAVLYQLDGAPLLYLSTGTAWREQAIADKAAGLYDEAADLAQRAEAAAERMSSGIGYGAMLGVGALLVGAAFVVAPELSTEAAIRTGRGIRRGVAQSRKR